MTRNIASVEEKLGRPLRKLDPRGPEAGRVQRADCRSRRDLIMDRSRFDTRAVQLRAYAQEVRTIAEDCVARATSLLSGENPTDLAGASPASRGERGAGAGLPDDRGRDGRG